MNQEESVERVQARRAVALPDWVWVPGMADVDGYRVLRVDHENPRQCCLIYDVDQPPLWGEPELPDFTDRATLNCFRDIVREHLKKRYQAYGAQWVSMDVQQIADAQWRVFVNTSFNGEVSTTPCSFALTTELDALLDAIENVRMFPRLERF